MQIDHIYDGAQAYFAYGAHPLADRWAGYSEGALNKQRLSGGICVNLKKNGSSTFNVSKSSSAKARSSLKVKKAKFSSISSEVQCDLE